MTVEDLFKRLFWKPKDEKLDLREYLEAIKEAETEF